MPFAPRGRQLRKPLLLNDHKFSRGIVTIIAGSKKYPGAAALTVGGARHGGAGYVKYLATDSNLQELVINNFPDVVPVASLSRERTDALVVGPGGASIKKLPTLVPIVLDSAALSLALKARDGITVVTPHEGELSLLRSQRGNRRDVAEHLARTLGITVVLKGPATVIASPGNKTFIDRIGGPELATAGSGDILAGLIGSMLATWRPDNSAMAHEVICNAITLHSRAGKYAARHFRSVTALEILDSLRHI
jgi:hydroxyethylthiazole kinase-like uncharacterized protein yjeF